MLKAMRDERANVRVEAALTLNAFGDPTGKVALVSEMVKAKEAQVKFASGNERHTFWDADDFLWWLKAAGALADLGNSNGYEIVKTTILSNKYLACKTTAIIQVPKFICFNSKRIDAEDVLLSAADDSMARIDQKLAENPDRRPSAELGYFDVVSQMLAQVGGKQEVAKLNLYAQHKDSEVRLYARAALHVIEGQKK